MRLLTFLCFFHFSGLNNAYSYAEMSDLEPVRSASMVGSWALEAWKLLSLSGTETKLDLGRSLIVNLVVRLQSGFLEQAPGPVLEKSPGGNGPAMERKTFFRKTIVIEKQESFLRQDPWSFLEQKGVLAALPSAVDRRLGLSGPGLHSVRPSGNTVPDRAFRRLALLRIHHSTGDDAGGPSFFISRNS